MPFLPFVSGTRHLPDVLTVPPTKACLLCAAPAGMDLYIQVYARRHLPSAVPWISEDRLLSLAAVAWTAVMNAWSWSIFRRLSIVVSRQLCRFLLDFPRPRDSRTKRYGQRAFTYIATSLWNVVPESIEDNLRAPFSLWSFSEDSPHCL